MEHVLGLVSEYRCQINRRHKTFVSALHYVLENGVDLYVNEHQKLRHYCARSTEGRRRRDKKKNAKSLFFTSRGAYVKLRYIAMLYTHLIGNRTRWWCLKCVIVYLA